MLSLNLNPYCAKGVAHDTASGATRLSFGDGRVAECCWPGGASIVPGTVRVPGELIDGGVPGELIDDGHGHLLDAAGRVVAAVDYDSGVIRGEPERD